MKTLKFGNVARWLKKENWSKLTDKDASLALNNTLYDVLNMLAL
jgi:hypothetical protein